MGDKKVDKDMSDLLNRIDLRFDFVASKLAEHIITDEGCWEHTGYTKSTGYGVFKIYVNGYRPQKRSFMAHRVAYAFYNGEDPGEKFVCHTCDNPKCINPDHLFLGTPKDNMDDMWSKGRGANQVGENNGACKLSEAVVLDILEEIKKGRSNKAIASRRPVTHSQVSLIRLGKSWRHVTEKAGYNPEAHRLRAA